MWCSSLALSRSRAIPRGRGRSRDPVDPRAPSLDDRRVPATSLGGAHRTSAHRARLASPPTSHSPDDPPRPTRRAFLTTLAARSALLVALPATRPPPANATEDQDPSSSSSSSTSSSSGGVPLTLRVAPSGEPHATVAAAFAAAAAVTPRPSLLTLHLAPGTYPERVVVPPGLADAVVVEPSPDAPPGAVVALAHRVDAPYQAAFEVSDGVQNVTLRGITVRHASPSVANNYAVFARPGSSLALERCDVSSDTGCGVAGEGATLRVSRCDVHDCVSHGVAVYGDLLGEFGEGFVEDCDVARCGGDGVLVRAGALGTVVGCRFEDVGGFGVEFVDPRFGSAARNNRVARGGKKIPVGFGGIGAEDDVVTEGNVLTR